MLGLSVRARRARRWLTTAIEAALLSLAFLFLTASSAAFAAVLVEIDKSAQQMTVSSDGRTLWRFPVSTGRAGYDTPSGSFRAFRLEEDHYSKEWDDAPMPHSIFFTKIGHAIHGYLDTKNIGRPASHGCVRLHPENAAKLFALVKEQGVLNTTVTLTGVAPRGGAPAVARPSDPLGPDYGRPSREAAAPLPPPVEIVPAPGARGYDGRYQQPYDRRYDDQRYGRRYDDYGRPIDPRYGDARDGRRYDPRYDRQADPQYDDERTIPRRRAPFPFFFFERY
jgi:hypothetical protein